MSSKRKGESRLHIEDSPLRKRIKPLTENQATLFRTIAAEQVILLDGSAGSGKTYISVYSAIRALLENRISKILITRPAVECGRSLGFIPGELDQKYLPYIIPVLNIMEEFISKSEIERCIEDEVIQFTPLAYCRGLTFKNTYAILSEAQNASKEELLMFLTRLGENSKLIIEGDVEQSDLRGGESGFGYALDSLDNTPGIGIVELGEADIVRHPLIKEILKRWY